MPILGASPESVFPSRSASSFSRFFPLVQTAKSLNIEILDRRIFDEIKNLLGRQSGDQTPFTKSVLNCSV